MRSAADFVIVGGGVHGASLAFHLAQMGAGSVMLLEKHSLASGPTGRSGAMIRPLFTEPVYIRLVLAATEMFRDWSTVVGGDAGYRRPGFLRIAADWSLEQIGAEFDLLDRMGVRYERVAYDDLSQYAPTATFHAGERGLFLPDGGLADPVRTTRALARAAERLGAEVVEGVAVTGLAIANGRIAGVETTQGRVATGVVVNCAGAWSRGLAALAGVDLPIEDHRTPTAILYAPQGFPPDAPIQSDAGNKVYMRALSPELLRVAHFGWRPDPADPDDFDETVGRDQLENLRQALRCRFPTMGHTPFFGGFSAIYDMTPDGHPIIGLAGGPDGFWCNCGWSGNGFASAPAVGRPLAQMIVGETPEIDLGAFAWPRDAQAHVRPDITHIHR